MTKKQLRFDGVLEYSDSWHMMSGPSIAGRDVIAEIHDMWPIVPLRSEPNVAVTLGVEPAAQGELWAAHGFTGTDVTPGDPPEITIGDWNLLERLYDLDGREVILILEEDITDD